MIRRNGGGELVIQDPQRILAILVILGMVVSITSYTVGQAAAIQELDRRVAGVENVCTDLDGDYMPRPEIEVNFKLVGEQLNRIEEKIDTLNHQVNHKQ